LVVDFLFDMVKPTGIYSLSKAILYSQYLYEGFPLEDREVLESLGIDGVEVLDVRIKSPNNPVVLVDGKLLVFKV